LLVSPRCSSTVHAPVAGKTHSDLAGFESSVDRSAPPLASIHRDTDDLLPEGGIDAVNAFLTKIVAWITSGYPEGVPGPDRVPLMALLDRRLSKDEVKTVTQALLDRGEFDHVDIGVQITQLTDELPREEDVERVRARLAKKGWPLDDPRGEDPTGGPT
jgi:hypothetical protein